VKRGFTLVEKALLFIATPFFVQLLFTLGYAKLADRTELLARHEYRSKALIGNVNWILVTLSTATTSAFAYYLTKDNSYLRTGKAVSDQFQRSAVDLSSIASGDQDQFAFENFLKEATTLHTLLEIYLQKSECQGGPLPWEQLMSPPFKQSWKVLSDRRTELLKTENRRLQLNANDLPEAQTRLKLFLLIGALTDILFGITFLYLFHVNIGSRIGILANNTERLRRNQALLPVQSGTDELSQLDRWFHQMASELQKNRLELEASEERLKNLIENMPIGLVTLNDDGTIRTINAEVAKLLGLAPEQVIGKNLAVLFEASNASHLFNLAEPDSVPTEIIMPDKLGGQKFLELTMKENQFKDEKVRLLTVNDITQRKENEQLKEQFLYVASHDLRGPLTSLQLSLQLLLKSSKYQLSERAVERISKAEKNLSRLVNLANDLLDFEKMTSGNLELNIKVFFAFEIIQSAIEAVGTLAEEKGISLEITGEDCQVQGDQDRLTQVMINLLTNAIRFSPPKSKIRSAVLEQPYAIEFQVIDQGRGIPLEYQSAIFEKYKQVMPLNSAEKRGTGLGLPICKAIVGQHGGRIGVMSETGKGSTFWFRLPKDLKPQPDEQETPIT
jgi:PAS domain S-box-containing protein